jgi:hypothetical protein
MVKKSIAKKQQVKKSGEAGDYKVLIDGKAYSIYKSSRDNKWRVRAFNYDSGKKFLTLKAAIAFAKKHRKNNR